MERTKNIIGITLLFIIIGCFVIGGYVLMIYFTKENPVSVESKEETEKDLRLDKSKDYVYYENGDHLIESEELHKDEAYFNYKDLANINSTLKSETDALYQEIKYTKDMELPTTREDGSEITYNTNDEGIYSLKYRNYEDNKFGSYVNLLVQDYYYDIVNGHEPIAVKSYVVDATTGILLTEEELLQKFEVTMDTIKEKVKTSLENTNILLEGEMVVDINATLSGLDTNRAITVNKNGKLAITFIVKSNQNNYNDSVEIN